MYHLMLKGPALEEQEDPTSFMILKTGWSNMAVKDADTGVSSTSLMILDHATVRWFKDLQTLHDPASLTSPAARL